MTLTDTITTALESSPLIQGGAVLMAMGWVGYQLRELPRRIFGFGRSWLTREIEIRQNHPLYGAWLQLATEGAVRRGGPRVLEVRAGEGDDRETEAAGSSFAAGSGYFWSRICGTLCRVRIGREDSDGGKGRGGGESLIKPFIIEIEALLARRSTLNRMLIEAKRRGDVVENRVLVHLCKHWGSSKTLSLPARTPDTLCLPPGFYDAIESRVLRFVNSRDRYERTGIPWRFGLMLSGAPGTGKTSIAHVLASRLGLRLAIIPLADVNDDADLIDTFANVPSGSAVLLEDVDCAFADRKGEDAKGVTFSGLLNCIDGMVAPHNGRILIMTTNHPDRLDPALVRPGRVDLHQRVPSLDISVAADYIARVFPELTDGPRVAGLTPADRILIDLTDHESPTPADLLNRIHQEATG